MSEDPDIRTTGRVSDRAKRALDRLHDRPLNYDPGASEADRAAAGWHIDDYAVDLPREAPGPPVPHGSFQVARGCLEDYEFADPDIVRAVYRSDVALEDRNILLEARFYGLRFLLGLRVGGVIDGVEEVDGRRTHRFGWNYRTLQGHLEMGQMDFEVRKVASTGAVSFRIHAFSRPAEVANPIVRLGLRLFGRHMQRRFAARALERMQHLVQARVRGEAAAEGSVLDAVDVRTTAETEPEGQRLRDLRLHDPDVSDAGAGADSRQEKP